MESVKAVLFDFGDTLVDEDVFLLAADQAAIDVVLRHHGFPGPVSRYLPAYRAAISAAWRDRKSVV